jgi:hypothetical protein
VCHEESRIAKKAGQLRKAGPQVLGFMQILIVFSIMYQQFIPPQQLMT